MKSVFKKKLAQSGVDPEGRQWLFVPYDQLTDAIGPLSGEDPKRLGIVVVETAWKAGRRPYHKQKLALILANLRHFALEQAARGVAVKHVVSDGSYASALESLIPELGPLRVMTPAERELRADLQPLKEKGGLVFLPHQGWLTTPEQFEKSLPKGPPWRMDAFYRYVRRDSGILMAGRKPVGGKFSFDAENRQPWRGDPPPPEPSGFPIDAVKEEVGALIEVHFAHHPGRLDVNRLPATAADAASLWSWAKEACLPHFGPYEDAMTVASQTLFHTRISALLNIHRLLPVRVVSEAEQMDIPFPSKEGFIRQVLGWREFVRHVHVRTDGFREGRRGPKHASKKPGDGGYERWFKKAWPSTGAEPGGPDGGAEPNFLACETPLPPCYWGEASGLACLDHVVAGVWGEGYGHHITRLMILSNLATLLDVRPRQLTDWFWIAYTDAYDWVVEPNVLGMGTFSLGDLMTTKPYVSGAAYINRMSDFCKTCTFHPKKDCPITPLYWAFLDRHKKKLQNNPRMKIPLASLKRRGTARRRQDQEVFRKVRQKLLDGLALGPPIL
jgi:deoxyribodipyrimidine photolyase-related protein